MAITEPPFELMIGTDEEVITNPYSGESVKLPPVAVAVYDFIKGAEMVGDETNLRKALDWFIKNFPEEYMVLLD